MNKSIRSPIAIIFACLASLTAFASSAWSRSAEVYTGTFSSLALGGYDTVAYFTVGKPTKGSDKFQTEYKGALWYFASQENLDKFKANPDAYRPQFGGYCAWAVSQGYTASADPHAWRIVDGKLYVNYDKSVQATWEKDIPGNIAKANKNWPKVLE
ncbi:MAG TPA: YHS domain protein [Alphaproteobacteria bacterium]|nr:YHS domain protein [Alphaproteobacteria bacterium]HAJ48670.1 YHS domain protein [Alphaproteobacteria bacterium]